ASAAIGGPRDRRARPGARRALRCGGGRGARRRRGGLCGLRARARGSGEVRRRLARGLRRRLAGIRGADPLVSEVGARGRHRVFLDVDVATAWKRVEGSDRPLAQREEDFRTLFEERMPVYLEVADAVAADAEGVLLDALRIAIPGGVLTAAPYVVVGDEHVLK